MLGTEFKFLQEPEAECLELLSVLAWPDLDLGVILIIDGIVVSVFPVGAPGLSLQDEVAAIPTFITSLPQQTVQMAEQIEDGLIAESELEVLRQGEAGDCVVLVSVRGNVEDTPTGERKILRKTVQDFLLVAAQLWRDLELENGRIRAVGVGAF